MLCRENGGNLVCSHRIQTVADGFADRKIDMALIQQIVGMLVVGGKGKTIGVAFIDNRYYFFKIALGGSLAHQHVHTFTQFFQCFGC